jgi:uncharacterized protein (DUF1778 family)
MARPLKDPSDRKTVDVRIPLTEDQKKVIAEAAAADGADVATWARPLLLELARARTDGRNQPVRVTTQKRSSGR